MAGRAFLNADDRGTAIVEFLVIGLVLTLPLIYVAIAVLRIHGALVVSQSAAAQAALQVARGDLTADRAPSSVATRLAPGVEDPTVSVTCRPMPCTSPDGLVSVRVRAAVRLPLVPDGLDPITISTEQSQVVDRFGGSRG